MLGSAEERTANVEDFHVKLEKFQSYMPDTKFLAGTVYTNDFKVSCIKFCVLHVFL